MSTEFVAPNFSMEFLVRPFEPVVHGLDRKFRLSSFADMKGKGAKVPRDILLKLLEAVTPPQEPTNGDQNNSYGQSTQHQGMISYWAQQQSPQVATGIGMDTSVTPLRHAGLMLVQTTDIFFPMIDDPYMLGKIACANTLSELYAIGVMECDNILLQLGIPLKMTDHERDIIIPLIMRGFKDCADEAGTRVEGGQTIYNHWLMIGGVGTAVCQQPECILPFSAVPGDVLVLTKPLGIQIALTAHDWLGVPEKWSKIKSIINEEEVKKAYYRAMHVMARLNRTAARLMHKYNAHGAIDVTGFGLLAHAQNLARIQKADVSFVIHNLPVIAKMAAIAKISANVFGLLQGTCLETSGGLLIALPREQAAAFCKDIEKTEGFSSWIVGIVEKGQRTARIIDKPRVIEVPAKEKDGELW